MKNLFIGNGGGGGGGGTVSRGARAGGARGARGGVRAIGPGGNARRVVA